MRIFLIRHPRPLIAGGVCYGRLDVDCEDPEPVAAALALPPGTPVVCSPLRRARRLAEALDPMATVDARLAEIDFGDWEGQPWSDLPREAIDAWAADVLHYAPPGGESVAALYARAVDLARSLDQRRHDIALVSHAGVMRALVGYWQDLPDDEWTRLSFEFGRMTVIER